ncbi:MAG: protein kinase [Acidobacteriota bacterium]
MDSIKTLGKYSLIEKISDGYLGSVYKSFDRDLDRAVEIRIFCEGIKWKQDLVGLLREECRRVSKLRHRNVTALIDFSVEGIVPFMVLEPLGKVSLRSLIARKPAVPFESKIAIMTQIAEGLSFAHNNGVVHRNLCPEDMFLTKDGHIKIRDFEIAHILGNHLPHPGVRWGAPIYLAPEQIQKKICNRQSDIFALGIVLYELITGAHPFYDPDSNRALDNILQDRPFATFEQYPNFHPRIWHILKRCLANKPENRYQNADEVLQACQDLSKEMAEDVQLMLSEMQASFASLKAASESPDASIQSARLCKKIWNILRGVDESDYVRLDILLMELTKIYPEIQAAASRRSLQGAALLPILNPEETQSISEEDSVPGEERDAVSAKRESIDSVAGMQESGSVETSFHSASAKKADSVKADLSGTSTSEEGPVISKSEDDSSHEVKPEVDKNSSPQPGLRECNPDEPTDPSFSEATIEVSKIHSPAEDSVPSGIASLRQSVPSHRQASNKNTSPLRKQVRILKSTYRIVAALVLILLIVAAAYSAINRAHGETILGAWKAGILDSWLTVKTSAFGQPALGDATEPSIGVADISIVESDSEYESKLMDSLEAGYPAAPAKERIDRVRTLISRGELDQAAEELDRLKKVFPHSTQVDVLHQQLLRRNSGSRSEKKGRDESKPENLKNKDESWKRQFDAFFSKGDYREAENVIDLWLEDVPSSSMARQSRDSTRLVRAKLASATLAVREKRYNDALAELEVVERINPSDPDIASIQKEIGSRMTTAKSQLTVLRLGPQATVLFDDRKIGDNGEVREAIVPIGRHTVKVEKDGYMFSSRSLEFKEGQNITLVYDLAGREIRPMAASDRARFDQREAMEKVHSFSVEHSHGFLRGSCQGELCVSHSEVVYQPLSGDHGFRIPFKILKFSREGDMVSLFLVAGNELYQKLKLDSEQSAARLNRIWNELESLPQN